MIVTLAVLIICCGRRCHNMDCGGRGGSRVSSRYVIGSVQHVYGTHDDVAF